MTFQNKFSNNLNVETLKSTTADLLLFTNSNAIWQAHIRDAQLAISKLEVAQSNEHINTSLLNLKKFSNQIKEVRDWSTIVAAEQTKPLVLTVQKILNTLQKLQNMPK